jgi:hypothetical protein
MAGHPLFVEMLGWAATGVFVGSYFFSRPEVLVRVQVAGALMWVAYGALVHATPVIAANLLVVGAAVLKARGSWLVGLISTSSRRVTPPT